MASRSRAVGTSSGDAAGRKASALKEPEIVWLPPDLLVPNPWNPNRMDAFMYARAVESIKEYGFIDPITARPKDGKFEIIDGEHRWRGARDLGITLLPVFVVTLNDAKAMKLTVLLNELRGTADPASMGDLLKELLSYESLGELTKTIPFTGEAISAMTGFKDLDWSMLDSKPDAPVEEKKERWVERTYRMPAAVAMLVDEAIEKAKDGDDIENWMALERIAADFIA